MDTKVYDMTECWCCGVRYDNTYTSWPFCPNCGSPILEELSVGQIEAIRGAHKGRQQVHQGHRDTIARQQAEIERLTTLAADNQDLALEHYGLLITIRSWLLGELPEATAQQFIDMIADAQQPQTIIARAALDSEGA